MKKIYLAVFSLFLIWPFQVEAKELFVKMAFGLKQGGSIDGAGDSINDYFEIQHLEPEKLSLGMDLSFESIYQFSSHIGVSLGFSFTKQTPEGPSAVFIPPDDWSMDENFQFSPVFSSEIYSVYVNGIYFLPLPASHQMYVFGGMGYYLGTFLCGHDADDVEFRFYNFKKEFFCWSYESDVNTLGYHIGAGIDFGLSNNLYISFEGLYRVVSFSIHKTSVIYDSRWIGMPFPVNYEEAALYGEDSTFFYGYRTDKNAAEGDIQYNVNNFDFSGFTLRLALKFKF
jgi:opacity protein-like surface antigen